MERLTQSYYWRFHNGVYSYMPDHSVIFFLEPKLHLRGVFGSASGRFGAGRGSQMGDIVCLDTEEIG